MQRWREIPSLVDAPNGTGRDGVQPRCFKQNLEQTLKQLLGHLLRPLLEASPPRLPASERTFRFSLAFSRVGL
jgi:hypothetical protein